MTRRRISIGNLPRPEPRRERAKRPSYGPTGGGVLFQVEPAFVYRPVGDGVSGRRFFTARAAVKAYAANRIRTKHSCNCRDETYDFPGYVCIVHDGETLRRYVRWLMFLLRRRKK
jgi:hypothetical protein